jgi:BirA family biotin operon repressor/biotin-[acetyl-CoA-carboxylase] ligase
MDIVRVDEVGSTNDLCAELGLAGAPTATAVIARRQTAGRGRLARAWLELDGDNLFLSVLHRTELPVERISGLTLAVGLAVAEALDTLGLDVGLKWPNDLIVAGRKLGGILCELHDHGGARFAVVGVGLNVGARVLPPPIAATATSMALLSSEAPSIQRVEDLVVAAVRTAASRYERDGRPDVARWQARSVGVGAVGCRVRSSEGRRGVVQGIASDGALLLLWDGGERPEPFIAGELVAEP